LKGITLPANQNNLIQTLKSALEQAESLNQDINIASQKTNPPLAAVFEDIYKNTSSILKAANLINESKLNEIQTEQIQNIFINGKSLLDLLDAIQHSAPKNQKTEIQPSPEVTLQTTQRNSPIVRD